MVESEYLDLLQDSELCSPEGRDCIEKYSREAFGCEILCEGLYAGVGKSKVEKVIRQNQTKLSTNVSTMRETI